jgi:hypothetical protein
MSLECHPWYTEFHWPRHAGPLQAASAELQDDPDRQFFVLRDGQAVGGCV